MQRTIIETAKHFPGSVYVHLAPRVYRDMANPYRVNGNYFDKRDKLRDFVSVHDEIRVRHRKTRPDENRESGYMNQRSRFQTLTLPFWLCFCIGRMSAGTGMGFDWRLAPSLLFVSPSIAILLVSRRCGLSWRGIRVFLRPGFGDETDTQLLSANQGALQLFKQLLGHALR